MTQEEHLNKIVAKCRELLAIADKRTQGDWCVSHANNHGLHAIESKQIFISSNAFEDDAAFIANCAGSAEAGWRATIAAIEALRSIQNVAWNGVEMHPCGMDAAQDVKKIIAAWPEELL